MPNMNDSIHWYQHVRHGRKCKVGTVRGQSTIIQRHKDASFSIYSPKLFDVLPKIITEIIRESILRKIPDEPVGFTAMRRVETK